MFSPPSRTRRFATVAAAAAGLTALTMAAGGLPGATAAPESPPPSVAAAPAPPTAETCAPYGEIHQGKYWLNNNVWGADSGTGHQCTSSTRLAGDMIGWRSTWDWSGGQYSVKSYASAVLGWHWGWKRPGSGLPIRLSDNKSVVASWDYTVTPADPGTMNVAYDMWVHDVAQPDWGDDPTDEVMVWLYRSGGAGPIGQKIDTVTIAGTRWDLYKGSHHWNVYSFVRTTNTRSSALDLTDFTDELVRRGEMSGSKHLSSVQAGPEIFTGKGTLDTTSYRVAVK